MFYHFLRRRLRLSITFFSILSSALWSLIFLALCFKSASIIEKYGLRTLWILYALCAVRIVLMVEFPFTVEVPFPLFNPLMAVADAPLIISLIRYRISDALVWLWAAVALILIIKDAVLYVRLRRRCAKMPPADLPAIENALREIGKPNSRIRYVLGDGEGATLTGIVHPVAVIPSGCTGEPLRYIVAHMETHQKRHDVVWRLLPKLFINLFWWFPTLRLAQEDIVASLETACDEKVLREQNFDREAYRGAMKKAAGKHAWNPLGTPVINERSRSDWLFRSPKTKKRPWKPLVVAVLLFVFSYVFILQSHFEAPLNGGYVPVEAVSDQTYIEPYYFWYALHDAANGSSRVISAEEKDRLKEEGVPLIQVK